MSRRNMGIAIAVVGVIISVIAVAADAFGLSGSGSDGFGNRQTAGLAVGLVLVAAGAIVAFRNKSAS